MVYYYYVYILFKGVGERINGLTFGAGVRTYGTKSLKRWAQ